MTESIDLDQLRQWLSHSETRTDALSPWTAQALAATVSRLGNFEAGVSLPPLWQWAYFLPIAPMNEVGADGHPARGGFLPPVPLPRRMWAGSRVEFAAPLHIGEPATKTSRVADVQLKQGKSGALVFVRVEHEFRGDDGVLRIREEQDIVYREPARPGEAAAPMQAPADAAWMVTRNPDPVQLFRYSALTFNGHRIHYDHPYATQVEGYAGLVVHGPLIATLLLEEAQSQHPGCAVRRYTFKAVRPLICGTPLRLCGNSPDAEGRIELWTEDDNGHLLMQATAVLA